MIQPHDRYTITYLPVVFDISELGLDSLIPTHTLDVRTALFTSILNCHAAPMESDVYLDTHMAKTLLEILHIPNRDHSTAAEVEQLLPSVLWWIHDHHVQLLELTTDIRKRQGVFNKMTIVGGLAGCSVMFVT